MNMYMDIIGWLLAVVLLLIIELLTLGLTTIWFAGGAFVALIAAIIGVGLPLQILLFFVVSMVLLFITRPIAMKRFNTTREKTNAESLIGKTAVVIEAIDTVKGKGRVVVQGMEWAAKCNNSEETIAIDQKVIVEDIQGVKLIVSIKEEETC